MGASASSPLDPPPQVSSVLGPQHAEAAALTSPSLSLLQETDPGGREEPPGIPKPLRYRPTEGWSQHPEGLCVPLVIQRCWGEAQNGMILVQIQGSGSESFWLLRNLWIFQKQPPTLDIFSAFKVGVLHPGSRPVPHTVRAASLHKSTGLASH